MIIKDVVYGEMDVSDQILVDLIHSPPLQRLKKVSQGGYVPGKYVRTDFTRYSHCVGVMLLLRRYGASVEEQIAGLLHDVPHIAFSHVIDWVFSKNITELESYHENLHEEIVLNSEISSILKKYGYEPKHFIDLSKFTMLEKNLPDICADRLDYSLRHFYLAGKKDVVQQVLKKLNAREVNGEKIFIFEDLFVGKLFLELFLELYGEHLYSPSNYARYHFLSKAIKIALDIGILKKTDLMTDDEVVFDKLKKSKNEEIVHLLSHLINEINIIHADKGEEDLFAISPFKYVDPYVHFEGKFIRVTEALPEINVKISEERTKIEKGCYLKIEIK